MDEPREPRKRAKRLTSEWADAVARGIGERVAYYRGQRDLSARELADRCRELGLPSVTQVVITKLENGRRESVSTAEIQVLGQALGVAPILLIFGLGHVGTVEVLPGQDVDPWAAIDWFTGGLAAAAGSPHASHGGVDTPVAMWAEHLRYDQTLPFLLEGQRSATPQERAQAKGGLVVDVAAEAIIAALRRIRADLRALGMTPPPLHPESARALGEPPEPGDVFAPQISAAVKADAASQQAPGLTGAQEGADRGSR